MTFASLKKKVITVAVAVVKVKNAYCSCMQGIEKKSDDVGDRRVKHVNIN